MDTAREYLGSREGSRAVLLIFSDDGVLVVRSFSGELLRSVDFSKTNELDLIIVGDGKHVVVKNPKEYDCVFSFESKILRTAFINQLKQRFKGKVRDTTGSLSSSLQNAFTKD